MVTNDEEGSVLKSIRFSGKKYDYQIWAANFLSYAHCKGFKKILLGKVICKSESACGTDKEKLAVRRANHTAYPILHICVKDDVSFNAIYSATTEVFPDGDAKLAWENLATIF
jgi:hypothetical protein